MRLFLTAIIFLGGLLFCFIGLGFLISPESQGADFGISATSNTGIGAIRGDMTAFFMISGLSMLYGAWKRNGDILLIPAFMMGCALLGRLITMFTHGTDDQFFQPMMVEAVIVVVTLLGSRILPHSVADGIADGD
ncbi:DUF4345 family protein [Pontixanthobacter aestiaquae]|uniref:DUF4345 domain-containing protein n=1 Tax=Pontixanthobacter aestiaquae TaxID=1509367 RepID=A0A844Z3H7_9SPHN|nr:DUF4345 family protein [Pontixanthobacter aestiaquae]MDN3646527.1 DUF4345 family protein [Pontixanthobacter aestiaquae]MXO82485.1 DUF4345 domain-containing protein [Pontixanthobacter aestiaquae]